MFDCVSGCLLLPFMYMGKTHATVLVVFSVGLLFLLQSSDTIPLNTEQRLVGDTLYVVTFTDKNIAKGNILFQVPFNTTTKETQEISIAVDINGDSIFSDAETFVTSYPVSPQKDFASGFYIPAKTVFTDGLTAQVTINNKSYMLMTEVMRHEVGELFNLSNVTKPEEAMKGWFTDNTRTPLTTTDVTHFTDFTQKKDECAPTVAINSAYYLLKKQHISVPDSPQTHIDELKTDMDWGTTNGVTPHNYITGFINWAKRHDYPLTVKKIGDAHGNTTLSEIKQTLEEGNAVNIRVKFINTNTNTAVGGHAVTVTRIYVINGMTYIAIHDPATPKGTEVIRVQSNQFVHYGPWEGISLLSWAFAHSVVLPT